jgi:hypothetical protein
LFQVLCVVAPRSSQTKHLCGPQETVYARFYMKYESHM